MRIALLFVLSLSAALQGVRVEADAEPAGSVVYERPAPGARRGLLSVPAPVVYGVAALALVGSAAYLLARSRRRPR